MIAVLAGNRQQYQYWLQEHGLRDRIDARHMNAPYQLRGLRFTSFVRVGTWLTRQPEEIEEFLMIEKFNVPPLKPRPTS